MNKMDEIYDCSLKNIECVQSMKLIVKKIEEVEAFVSSNTSEDYRGLANLLDLVADKIDEKVTVILDLCDPANG